MCDRRTAIRNLLLDAERFDVLENATLHSPEGTDDDLRLEAWGRGGSRFYRGIDKIEAFCDGLAMSLSVIREMKNDDTLDH